MNAFAALSDNTRRKIIELVARKGELTSTEIGKSFRVTAPAISQHLKVLKEARVLKVKKEAQKRIYSINQLQDSGILEISGWVEDIIAESNMRLDRLGNFLSKK